MTFKVFVTIVHIERLNRIKLYFGIFNLWCFDHCLLSFSSFIKFVLFFIEHFGIGWAHNVRNELSTQNQ